MGVNAWGPWGPGTEGLGTHRGEYPDESQYYSFPFFKPRKIDENPGHVIRSLSEG
jgi:hypothetical protein